MIFDDSTILDELNQTKQKDPKSNRELMYIDTRKSCNKRRRETTQKIAKAHDAHVST